ncbi:hypothetical protein KIPB_011723 [Kipferlia bialata]|uniref:Uncharacterized protein n=1 Tax=Kipferlia bialata TaxID=797122 RepID=A0A9K3GNC9_9EUKA|nr:hypothetical protein KIPB_011723 [Kipferlia bialata]|eukprot:g11723.t1
MGEEGEGEGGSNTAFWAHVRQDYVPKMRECLRVSCGSQAPGAPQSMPVSEAHIHRHTHFSHTTSVPHLLSMCHPPPDISRALLHNNRKAPWMQSTSSCPMTM